VHRLLAGLTSSSPSAAAPAGSARTNATATSPATMQRCSMVKGRIYKTRYGVAAHGHRVADCTMLVRADVCVCVVCVVWVCV